MFHDVSVAHSTEVTCRDAESNVQMTQLPSGSVGEVQRLVTSSRLQAFEVVVRDLR